MNKYLAWTQKADLFCPIEAASPPPFSSLSNISNTSSAFTPTQLFLESATIERDFCAKGPADILPPDFDPATNFTTSANFALEQLSKLASATDFVSPASSITQPDSTASTDSAASVAADVAVSTAASNLLAAATAAITQRSVIQQSNTSTQGQHQQKQIDVFLAALTSATEPQLQQTNAVVESQNLIGQMNGGGSEPLAESQPPQIQAARPSAVSIVTNAVAAAAIAANAKIAQSNQAAIQQQPFSPANQHAQPSASAQFFSLLANQQQQQQQSAPPPQPSLALAGNNAQNQPAELSTLLGLNKQFGSPQTQMNNFPFATSNTNSSEDAATVNGIVGLGTNNQLTFPNATSPNNAINSQLSAFQLVAQMPQIIAQQQQKQQQQQQLFEQQKQQLIEQHQEQLRQHISQLTSFQEASQQQQQQQQQQQLQSLNLPELMNLPALLNRLNPTPQTVRSNQINTAQSTKPIPLLNERVDLLRFRRKEPREWDNDDVIAWILDVARRHQIPCENLNMHKFSKCTGPLLMLMNEQSFKEHDPCYGTLIFGEFCKLVTDETFIDEWMRSMRNNVANNVVAAVQQSSAAAALMEESSAMARADEQQPGPSNEQRDRLNQLLGTTSAPSATANAVLFNQLALRAQQQQSQLAANANHQVQQVQQQPGQSNLLLAAAAVAQAAAAQRAIAPLQPAQAFLQAAGQSAAHGLLEQHQKQLIQEQQQRLIQQQQHSFRQNLPVIANAPKMMAPVLQLQQPSAILTTPGNAGPSTGVRTVGRPSTSKALDPLKIRKNKDGRPRKRSQHTKGNKLWEFIRDALKDPRYCPSVVRWEDPIEGVFRIVESERLANLWGQKKNNQKMTYEKLSRAMRTYYDKEILVPVPKSGLYPKKLVYKFGPSAHGWNMTGGTQTTHIIFTTASRI